MNRFIKTAATALAVVIGSQANVLAADVVIGVPNWPSATATANIMKVVIEENLGVEVGLQSGTNPIIFEAMDKGSIHVHPEVWLPNQQNLHDTYVKEKKTVLMNQNGVEAFTGMCVPKAVSEKYGITSLEDLTDPDKAALFDSNGDGKGEIWIGAPGWASTTVEKIRAKSYGYGELMELVTFDETLAYSNLAAAIKADKPWVGVCYTPHYIFSLHDLVPLEEPKHDPAKWTVIQPTDDPAWLEKSEAAVAWGSAYLYVHYAKVLEEQQPEVAAIMKNIKLDGETINAMTYAIAVDKQDPAEFAKKWVADNEDTILDWLK